MAESLLGVHANWRCSRCGWEFDYAPADGTRDLADFVAPSQIVCPNCRAAWAVEPSAVMPRNGDRILVHKWVGELGALFAPKRWDVIVFRDPLDPSQNYIKRLIALPGESVEIVQGDIYINGEIQRARKPESAQRALWYIVFDQAHVPPADAEPDYVRWRPESESAARCWSGLHDRIIRFDAVESGPQSLTFDAGPRAEYFRDMYAYNHGDSRAYVGDLRLRAEFQWKSSGVCRWELRRDHFRFTLSLISDGTARLRIEDLQSPGSAIEKNAVVSDLSAGRGGGVFVEFAHLDYRVYVRVNGRDVLWTDDSEYRPDLSLLRRHPDLPPPALRISGEGGAFELGGLRIDRDVHYLAGRALRAAPGQPFLLGEDEFFVLGDNSPDSHDSREWFRFGPHLPENYRVGTVRRDQIVGQAAFVYLPGLLPMPYVSALRVPDVGRTRFVR